MRIRRGRHARPNFHRRTGAGRLVLIRAPEFSALVCMLFLALFGATPARAASKEECIDAHGRGQDQREKGQLVRARQSFLSCAQNGCPSLIQGDCARFGEELSRLVPSVSLGARDAHGGDLPNTSVTIDDALVATRLDDGKSIEVDPGKHLFRFVHDDREAVLKVIVNQGERGRSVVATFVEPTPVTPPVNEVPPPPHVTSRPVLPWVVAGLGAAAAIAGGVVMVIGFREVPSNCSVSAKECAASPGDPAFASASRGVTLIDTGLGVAIGGATALAFGTLWHLASSAHPEEGKASDPGKRSLLRPWVGRGSGGFTVVRTF